MPRAHERAPGLGRSGLTPRRCCSPGLALAFPTRTFAPWRILAKLVATTRECSDDSNTSPRSTRYIPWYILEYRKGRGKDNSDFLSRLAQPAEHDRNGSIADSLPWTTGIVILPQPCLRPEHSFSARSRHRLRMDWSPDSIAPLWMGSLSTLLVFAVIAHTGHVRWSTTHHPGTNFRAGFLDSEEEFKNAERRVYLWKGIDGLFPKPPPYSLCALPMFWRKPAPQFVPGGVLSYHSV